MAYIPKWEPLSDALACVEASGSNGKQAKVDICNAVADREIAVRVTVDKSNQLDGGMTFSGKNVGVPPHLNTTDFDWAQSRPLKEWFIGPQPGQHYYWNGGNRPISLIELSTADVREVLCNARSPGNLRKDPTNSRNAGRRPKKLDQVKAAMMRDIEGKKHTPGDLRKMYQKTLAAEYGASRETVCKALEDVLSEINSRQKRLTD
jgi:hypothetical protein